VDDGVAILRVQDSGIGISSEMLSRIFEMFTQVLDTHMPTHGGLGIGLSLVKELVTMQGGTITATNDGLGNGSEFVVWLPTSAAICVQNERAPTNRPGLS
jgi:signal transduction histidine kinase